MRSGTLGSLVAIERYRQPVLRGLDTTWAALAQGIEYGTVKASVLELAPGAVPNLGVELENHLVFVAHHRVGCEVVGDPVNPADVLIPCRVVVEQGAGTGLFFGKPLSPQGVHFREVSGAQNRFWPIQTGWVSFANASP